MNSSTNSSTNSSANPGDKTRRALEEEELLARIAATDPRQDAWVAANAGSGKTRILRNRVIRLMLDGTPPDRILCLTYTRAAAAEMQGRIFAELARWVTLDEPLLDAAIGELVSTRPGEYCASPQERGLARGLFARAIEAPGGLKVQTIHAFAERVLHLFPIEARVPLDFAILMEDEARALRDNARRATLAEALASPATDLNRAFGELLAAAGLNAFGRALDEALDLLSRLELDERSLPLGAARFDAYRKALGVARGESLKRIETDLLQAFDAAEFEAAASAIAGQKKVSETQRALAHGFLAGARALRAPDPRPERVMAPFLTGKGEARAASVFTVEVLKRRPDLAALDARAKAHWSVYSTRRNGFLTLMRSLALTTFAQAVHARYCSAKSARSLLDFDDLIGALRRLLTSGQAAWVLFKLDSGIDHVLIDEAQDTTRAMWEIIAALTEEFFAGAGARGGQRRTLFAVGDEKQSIYSFQGAEPRVFEEFRAHFAAKSPRGALIRNPVPLTYSFRASDDVLGAVDDVFRPEDNRRGLTARGEALWHKSADASFPGHVEFWPPARARAQGEVPGHIRAAEAVARTIAAWLRQPERHLVDGRPVRPGDILILVRVRNAFFEAMRKALKLEGVPVAGADRLTLQNEPVICDLLALAQAVLVPEDDLALACVLKSPLFGLDEKALEQLARHRHGSLWQALEARGRTEGEAGATAGWPAIAAFLAALGERARHEAPFAFFAGLLSAPAPLDPALSVKAVMTRQFGAEITDPLHAFLHQALNHAQEGAGALLPFLLAQQSRQTQLKRDAEAAQDKVRVMTVHGAKGLEGRIVFLADAATLPDGRKDAGAMLLPLAPQESLLLWSGLARDAEPQILREERAARRAVLMGEYRRLLYVGMTRAADRLYVVSHADTPTRKEIEAGEELPDPEDPLEASWFQMLRRGLVRATPFGAEDILDPALPPRRKRHILAAHPAAPPRAEAAPPPEALAPPAWLRLPLGEERRHGVLTPSQGISPQLGEMHPPLAPLARRRGIALHKLFELLPHAPAAERRALGLRLLPLLAPELEASAYQAFLAPVLAVLSGATGARFFGPASRAEVAVAGEITLAGKAAPDAGRSFPVRGRIDRLVITPQQVDILDLKTGQPRMAAQDAGILRQMALYRALLGALYPGRQLACHILWLERGVIETLPEAALEAALAAL